MLKVTVSGDYRTTDRSVIIDFDKVSGVIPNIPIDCDEEEMEGWILSHVQNRFVGMWINADKRYNKRFNSIRTCFVDKIEEVDGEPLCIGKDIKEMTAEELQHLAVTFHLTMIPKGSASIRSAREVAYIEYCKNVLGQKIDKTVENFKFALLPPIFVYNKVVKVAGKKIKSQEEIIRDEVEGKENVIDETLPTALSMDELKSIAKQKGVKFNGNISYENLYNRLFGD
jgi:hypothetical protein